MVATGGDTVSSGLFGLIQGAVGHLQQGIGIEFFGDR